MKCLTAWRPAARIASRALRTCVAMGPAERRARHGVVPSSERTRVAIAGAASSGTTATRSMSKAGMLNAFANAVYGQMRVAFCKRGSRARLIPRGLAASCQRSSLFRGIRRGRFAGENIGRPAIIRLPHRSCWGSVGRRDPRANFAAKRTEHNSAYFDNRNDVAGLYAGSDELDACEKSDACIVPNHADIHISIRGRTGRPMQPL